MYKQRHISFTKAESCLLTELEMIKSLNKYNAWLPLSLLAVAPPIMAALLGGGLQGFGWTFSVIPALMIGWGLIVLLSSVYYLFLWALLLRKKSRLHASGWKSSLITGLCVVLFMFLVHQSTLLPVSGWDALTFWGPNAKLLLQEFYSPFPQSIGYGHRHPITVNWILASTAIFSSLNFYIPYWVLTSLLSTTALFCYAQYRGCGREAFFLPIFFLTLPLQENHVLLLGYAEVWLSLTALGAAILGSELVRTRSKSLWLPYGISLIAMATTKNIGIVYSLIFSLATVVVLFDSRPVRTLVILLASGVGFCCYALIYGAVKIGFDNKLLMLAYEDSRWIIELGGTRQFLEINPIGDIIASVLHSLLINQSFQVLTVCFVLVFWQTLRLGAFKDYARHRDIVFMSVVILTVLIVASLGEFLTDKAYRHALPGQDTGRSRFLLPVGALMMVYLSISLSALRAAATKSG